MNEIEEYETHEAWLARQQEVLDLIDATISQVNRRRDYWTDEPIIPNLGGTHRDGYYWSRWTWTVLEAIFSWLARVIEKFLIDVGDGLKRGLASPAVLISVAFIAAVVFMFMLGAGAL